jgi:hypothetical protein
MTLSFIVFIFARSYFSGIIRERRKNVQELQKNANSRKVILDNDEDLQSQADKHKNEFKSAVCDAEAYELYLIMSFVFSMT